MTLAEVSAFRAESDALGALVDDFDESWLLRKTQFKDWAVADILGHLYIWNDAAALTIADSDAFSAFFNRVVAAMQGPGGMRAFENELLAGLSPRDIADAWRQSVSAVCQLYGDADPRQRVKWGGPDMSVRSCISARLMETWAHGQAIFDLAGIDRIDSDRLHNIVMLGVNTFAFNFRINGLDVPPAMPALILQAPSGETWQFGDDADNQITGLARDFCQVVTQVRNIRDTGLDVRGETAAQWMDIAQCFAGPPNPPPLPGTRTLQVSTTTEPPNG